MTARRSWAVIDRMDSRDDVRSAGAAHAAPDVNHGTDEPCGRNVNHVPIPNTPGRTVTARTDEPRSASPILGPGLRSRRDQTNSISCSEYRVQSPESRSPGFLGHRPSLLFFHVGGSETPRLAKPPRHIHASENSPKEKSRPASRPTPFPTSHVVTWWCSPPFPPSPPPLPGREKKKTRTKEIGNKQKPAALPYSVLCVGEFPLPLSCCWGARRLLNHNPHFRVLRRSLALASHTASPILWGFTKAHWARGLGEGRAGAREGVRGACLPVEWVDVCIWMYICTP